MAGVSLPLGNHARRTRSDRCGPLLVAPGLMWIGPWIYEGRCVFIAGNRSSYEVRIRKNRFDAGTRYHDVKTIESLQGIAGVALPLPRPAAQQTPYAIEYTADKWDERLRGLSLIRVLRPSWTHKFMTQIHSGVIRITPFM